MKSDESKTNKPTKQVMIKTFLSKEFIPGVGDYYSGRIPIKIVHVINSVKEKSKIISLDINSVIKFLFPIS